MEVRRKKNMYNRIWFMVLSCFTNRGRREDVVELRWSDIIIKLKVSDFKIATRKVND
jgi:hypothetical protein